MLCCATCPESPCKPYPSLKCAPNSCPCHQERGTQQQDGAPPAEQPSKQMVKSLQQMKGGRLQPQSCWWQKQPSSALQVRALCTMWHASCWDAHASADRPMQPSTSCSCHLSSPCAGCLQMPSNHRDNPSSKTPQQRSNQQKRSPANGGQSSRYAPLSVHATEDLPAQQPWQVLAQPYLLSTCAPPACLCSVMYHAAERVGPPAAHER